MAGRWCSARGEGGEGEGRDLASGAQGCGGSGVESDVLLIESGSSERDAASFPWRLPARWDPACRVRTAEGGEAAGWAAVMAVSEMGAEGAGVRPGFTFSLISTLSVTTGNDNRLIIADKSPMPAD